MRLRYRLLGPLEVDVDGAPADLGRRQQRALLAILLLRANEPVSTDELVELLWPDRRPGKPLASIQGYISGLRKLLGAETIETVGGGYRINVALEALDTNRFGTLLAEGQLESALGLWRGPALADFAYETWAQEERNRLEELRLVARERFAEARLALGEHAELVGELEALVREQPLRERLRALLMLALYRSGRQAEALEEYGRTRELLVEQLGIDPSAELQELQRAILNQDDSLAAPAPPEKAGDGGGSRLPVPADSFVGRSDELRELSDLLCRSDVRLVSLAGPGGSGKTRLSVELGRRLASSFPAGVFWSPLAGISDHSVVGPAIAQAVGAESPESLPEVVGDGEALLVIDNAEHVVEEVAAVVAPALAGTERLTVLVTTRERLHVHGEHVIRVAPLADVDAAALFVDRAKALRPDFDAPTDGVVELCRRLDSLPLAIELAAGRTSVFSVPQILERLETRPEFLKGGRDADSRQRTLEALIAWSYDLLAADEQELLQRLSVFSSGFDLEAAEAVADADAELLESLVEKSLVHVEPGSDGARFVLLVTIRAFAAAHLAEQPGETARLRDAHADHYLGLAEEQYAVLNTADQLRAVDWFAREIDNLRAAAAHLAQTEEGTKLGRLAVATNYAMGTMLPAQEHWNWIERALEVGVDDIELRRRLRYTGTFTAYSQGRADDADRYSRELVADAEHVGSPRALNQALEARGIVIGGAEGVAMLRHALAVAESSGDPKMILGTASNLGGALLSAELFADAAVASRHALEIARSEGDRKWILVAQLNVAIASYFLGEFDTAAESAREARELADALRDRYMAATAMLVGGALAARAGDRDQASRDSDEAETILRELGLSLDPVEERLRQELHDLVAGTLRP